MRLRWRTGLGGGPQGVEYRGTQFLMFASFRLLRYRGSLSRAQQRFYYVRVSLSFCADVVLVFVRKWKAGLFALVTLSVGNVIYSSGCDRRERPVEDGCN